MSATKNMWVERCSHIGALVGGILSVLFGWVPKSINWAKQDIGNAIFLFVIFSGFAIISCNAYISIKNTLYAPPEYIKGKMIGDTDEIKCFRNYLPRYVSAKRDKNKLFIITYFDVKEAMRICEQSISSRKAQAAEDKFFAEQKAVFTK